MRNDAPNDGEVGFPWRFLMAGKGEWTCFYCGRLMKDVRAVRIIKDLPYTEKIHACPACDAVVPLGRSKTLHGRQLHVRKVFGGGNDKIIHRKPWYGEKFLYQFVDRYGVPFWGPRDGDE